VLDDLLENEAIADDEVLLEVNGRKVLRDYMKKIVTVGRIRRLAMNEDVWRYDVFATCPPPPKFVWLFFREKS
jgi:hypothetical protein